MHFVYILQSKKTNRYYIGSTTSIEQRLGRHNAGGVPSTRHGAPWAIVLSEQHQTKSEAMRREKEIKSYKGGILFKRLIGIWKE